MPFDVSDQSNWRYKLDLKKLTELFRSGPIVINESPVRSVGGKQTAPHLKTTAFHINWLKCDWINTESSFEADFVLVTSLDPTVSAIYHQRVSITLPTGSLYTPDFLVIQNGQPKIVEVKPYKFTLKPIWMTKLAHAKLVCDVARIPFEVTTELQFRIGNLHKRAEYMAYCAGLQFKSEDIALALDTVSRNIGGITIKEYVRITGLSKILLLSLVARRQLRLNDALEYENESIVKSSMGI